jgi:hypothetical protein
MSQEEQEEQAAARREAIVGKVAGEFLSAWVETR